MITQLIAIVKNKICSVFTFADITCYCEYTNEKNHSNGIMCGKNDNFVQTTHCGSDEICIHPAKISNAAFVPVPQCAKGTLQII